MNAVVDRILRDLEKQGYRLEAQAVREVTRLYANLNLAELITLLRAATELDSPLARLNQLDDLMRAFESAATNLKQPPEPLAQLIRQGVENGIAGTAQMFAASQQVIDAFTVPPLYQLQWVAAREKRLLEYWGGAQFEFTNHVRSAIREGLERGQGIDQIAKRIKDKTGTSRSRATLIARNEISSAASFAMSESQRIAGVESYIWRTASDDRVRDTHRARNGKEFKWDEPPPDGHPGEPVLCRCVALAVIPKGFTPTTADTLNGS